MHTTQQDKPHNSYVLIPCSFLPECVSMRCMESFYNKWSLQLIQGTPLSRSDSPANWSLMTSQRYFYSTLQMRETRQREARLECRKGRVRDQTVWLQHLRLSQCYYCLRGSGDIFQVSSDHTWTEKAKNCKIKTTHELDLTKDGKPVTGFPWVQQGAIVAGDKAMVWGTSEGMI